MPLDKHKRTGGITGRDISPLTETENEILRALATLEEANMIEVEECELYVPREEDVTAASSSLPSRFMHRVRFRFTSEEDEEEGEQHKKKSSDFGRNKESSVVSAQA